MINQARAIFESEADDHEMIAVTDWGAEDILGGPKVTFGTHDVIFQGEGNPAEGWRRSIDAFQSLVDELTDEWERRYGDPDDIERRER